MPDPYNYGLFVIAALALLLVPGPAVLYVVARGLEQGRWAGLVSALGIELGNLVYAVSASLGLTAILASSAIAFRIVKYLGAAYLIYLGMRRLLSDDDHTPIAVEHKPLPRVFLQGAIVAILNPKTALFFLAFLPQFVDGSHGAVWQQSLLLGLTFVGLGICTDSAYGLMSGTARGWLRRSESFRRGQRYFSGGIYLVLGTWAAISGSGKD